MKTKLLFIFFGLLIFKIEAQDSALKFADSLLQIGNYKAALLKLNAQKSPSFAELQKTASIYQKVGDYSKAIIFYKQASKKKKSDRIKEQIGSCYQSLGNTDEAIKLYNEVLKNNPQNLLLKYQLAKLYFSSRRVAGAEKLIKELIAADSLNPNYYYQLGKIYNKQKKDASKGFLRAYQVDNKHFKSIYELAKFYRLVKVLDSSEIFINKGLKIQPNNLSFLQLKAQNEYVNDRYDSTVFYLKKLEDFKYETASTLKLFGKAYYNLKDYEKALAYFRKGSKKDRRDASFLYQIGLTQYQLKEFKNAEMSFYFSIFGEEVDLSNHYFQLAQAQLAQKKTKKAIKSLEKGLENKPRNEELMYHLAVVSDSYYKDKKQVLKSYENYINRHENRNQKRTDFIKGRIAEIKKKLFINGEKVE